MPHFEPCSQGSFSFCDLFLFAVLTSFQAMLQRFMMKRSRSSATSNDNDIAELDDEDKDDAIEVGLVQQSSDDEDTEPGSGAEDGEGDNLDSDDDLDDGKVDLDRKAYDEREMDEFMAKVEQEIGVDDNAIRDGILALWKVTRLAKKIHYSATLRTTLLQVCAQKKCPVKILPHHVATRWNSLTRTILVAIDIKPALVVLTTGNKYGLRTLALAQAEWGFVEAFAPVLMVCHALSELSFVLLFLCLTDWFHSVAFFASHALFRGKGSPFPA